MNALWEIASLLLKGFSIKLLNQSFWDTRWCMKSKISTGNDRYSGHGIVESTALVEQKPLTTQFYLLLVESPL